MNTKVFTRAKVIIHYPDVLLVEPTSGPREFHRFPLGPGMCTVVNEMTIEDDGASVLIGFGGETTPTVRVNPNQLHKALLPFLKDGGRHE